MDQVIAMKKRLNSVSPSFCLAKWLQVTIHLHSGKTHSCHHPVPHHISTVEIANNPSALHNTSTKKHARRQMQNGVRPNECDYCWKVEDLRGEQISDRHLKSASFWAASHFANVQSLPWDADVNPTSVEVSFSRVCNFKCSYCTPEFSSLWLKEIEQHGLYAERPEMNICSSNELWPNDAQNPYLEAFWRWWPDLKKTLHVFRITGGEPLLSEETFRILESLKLAPEPHLQMAVNSNLGVSQDRINRFIQLANELAEQKKVASFRLYTSIDAWGFQAEYIRYGLDFKKFWQNIEMILRDSPKIQVVFMVTLNALSVPSFKEFLIQCLNIRKKYQAYSDQIVGMIDVNYLRYPQFQAVNILPSSFHDKMWEAVEFMKANFYDFESVKLIRTFDWMRSELELSTLAKNRRDFYRFFSEHDRRRGTDFAKTFPEMIDFWKTCGELSTKLTKSSMAE